MARRKGSQPVRRQLEPTPPPEDQPEQPRSAIEESEEDDLLEDLVAQEEQQEEDSPRDKHDEHAADEENVQAFDLSLFKEPADRRERAQHTRGTLFDLLAEADRRDAGFDTRRPLKKRKSVAAANRFTGSEGQDSKTIQLLSPEALLSLVEFQFAVQARSTAKEPAGEADTAASEAGADQPGRGHGNAELMAPQVELQMHEDPRKGWTQRVLIRIKQQSLSAGSGATAAAEHVEVGELRLRIGLLVASCTDALEDISTWCMGVCSYKTWPVSCQGCIYT